MERRGTPKGKTSKENLMLANRVLVVRVVAPAVLAAALMAASGAAVYSLARQGGTTTATVAEPRDVSTGQPSGKRTHTPISLALAAAPVLSGRTVVFLVPP